MSSFDESKRKSARQQDIGRRTRFHARTLGARIYADGKSVLLVRGKPADDALHDWLFSGESTDSELLSNVTPVQLGFDSSDVTPLTRGSLGTRSRSVQRWRIWVERQLLQRHNSDDAERLSAEATEIESLGSRVIELHRLLANGVESNSEFYLDSKYEIALSESIRRNLAGLYVPDEVSKLARIICWVTGLEASDRFLTTLRGGLEPESKHLQRLALERFRRFVAEIVDREKISKATIETKRQSRPSVMFEKLEESGTFDRVRSAFDSMDPAWLSENRLWLAKTDAEVDFRRLELTCHRLFHRLEQLPSDQIEPSQFQAFLDLRSMVMEAVLLIDRTEAEAVDQEKRSVAKFRAVLREERVFTTLRKWHQGLPEEAKGPGRIQIPARDSEIEFEELLRRTTEVQQAFGEPAHVKYIRYVALICLTDGSTIPLSWSAIRHRFEYSRAFDDFWALRKLPGYESLLKCLDDLHEKGSPEAALRCLTTGGTLDDFNWFAAHGEFYFYQASHGAAAGSFRKIVEWLQSHSAKISAAELDEFWKSIETDSASSVATSLSRFLGWLNRPSRQQVGEIVGLIKMMSLPGFRQPLIDRLRSWATPAAKSRLSAGITDSLPSELIHDVRRLAFYQRLAGQPVRIPGSVLVKLEAHSRRSAEWQFLESLGDRRDESQNLRFESLSRRAAASPDNESRTVAKLSGQLREVTVLTALMAAKVIIRDEIDRWWRSNFEFEPDLKRYRWKDLFGFVGWAESLPPVDRAKVARILNEFHAHGAKYKQYLPWNASWSRQAETAIELDGWRFPKPVHVTIPDLGKVVIKCTTDPIDVFLMGTRFGTCLSLHGGFNSASVITNAADANKAVVYAFRSDGTPIARKLVGVVPGWKLVGYRIYSNELSPELDLAIGRFCAMVAANAGLGLANSGLPSVLSGGFWYDDQAEKWSETAIEAMRELRPDFEIESHESIDPLLAILHRALRLSGDERTDALVELALTNDGWDDIVTFWMIRTGSHSKTAARPPEENDWNFGRRNVFHHIAAAGFAHALSDPSRFRIPDELVPHFRAVLVHSALTLIPPERDKLASAIDLMMREWAAVEEETHRPSFHICRISPVFAVMPFRAIVRLLRQYGKHFVFDEWNRQHTDWEMWPVVLRWTWFIDPDPGCFAEAIADPSPVVAKVMKSFCDSIQDRRFAGPLRRLMRSSPDSKRDEDWLRIQDRVRSHFMDNPIENPEKISEAIAIDISTSVHDRMMAVRASVDRTGHVDPILGVVISVQWTAAERSMLPIGIRRAFAAEMAVQKENEAWKTWPLLHWLATLPPGDQCEIILNANASRTSDFEFDMIEFLQPPGHFSEPSWIVLVQALEHADEHLRLSAETVFRMTVRRDPRIKNGMLRFAGPWIWPETNDRLRNLLDRETNASANSNLPA
jgi:hypothetical protein